MKKTALCVLMALLMVLLCACGKESPAEDFEYEMRDGEIIITGYLGTDQKIYIPEKIENRPVTTIGESAFEEYDMTHITIPNSVTLIDDYAFADCVCLTSVDFSDQLERINDYAFYNCTGLTKLSLPDSLRTIDSGAFSDCSALEKVSLPDGLEYLAAASFDDCENLSSLRIPDNTEIELSVLTQDAGYVGYVTMVSTPIGRTTTTTYYDSETNESLGDHEFEPLPTTIIVTKDSYAFTQIASYVQYGLTIKVE